MGLCGDGDEVRGFPRFHRRGPRSDRGRRRALGPPRAPPVPGRGRPRRSPRVAASPRRRDLRRLPRDRSVPRSGRWARPRKVDAAALLASPHAAARAAPTATPTSGRTSPTRRSSSRSTAGPATTTIQTQYDESLHGQAMKRGDPAGADLQELPRHARRSGASPTRRPPPSVMNIPALCGRCHHEGSPVQLTHAIPQDSILENYSESIHGEGCTRRGWSSRRSARAATRRTTCCRTPTPAPPSPRRRSSRPARSATPRSSGCTAR